jgi:imidazolonepropionase-like amidohydrolase
MDQRRICSRVQLAIGLTCLLVVAAAAQVPADDPTINLPMPKAGQEKMFAPMPYAPAATDAVVVYRHAGLIDGTGTPLKSGTTIVTRGQLIEVVAPDKIVDPARHPSARIVDLTGKYVLPGLIDSHQHLATPPSRVRAEAQMRRDLFGGITAVREMADDLRPVSEYNRAALMGEIPGPDIFTAALMAGPDFFKDPRTIMSAEGVKPGTSPWQQAVSDDSDVVIAVAKAKGTFSTGLKFYDQLSPDLMKRLTAEAHRQGMLVWAHGFVPPAAPEAVIDAGVDVISHTCYLAFQVSKDRPKKYSERRPVDYEQFAHGDNPEMARIFRKMAEKHILLDATLDVYEKYTAEAMQDAIKTGKPLPYCTIDLAGQLTKQAIALGVRVDAGTDDVPDYTTQFPALYKEMMLLHAKAGMTPLQVIVAATATGAETIGQKERMGTVTPGKFANLAIFAKNPAIDLNNLQSIVMTVKRGRVLDRASYRPVTADEIPD